MIVSTYYSFIKEYTDSTFYPIFDKDNNRNNNAYKHHRPQLMG